MFRRTTFARTGPLVPGVQACGSASSSAWSGAIIRTAQAWYCQPRPNGPHVSRWAFESPHSASFALVHSLASFICGEPVSRGPIRSISSLAVSMTFELWNSSCRICVTMSRSTRSSAGRATDDMPTRTRNAERRFKGDLLVGARGTVPPRLFGGQMGRKSGRLLQTLDQVQVGLHVNVALRVAAGGALVVGRNASGRRDFADRARHSRHCRWRARTVDASRPRGGGPVSNCLIVGRLARAGLTARARVVKMPPP